VKGPHFAGAAFAALALLLAPVILIATVISPAGAVIVIAPPSDLREGVVPEPYRLLIARAARTCRPVTAPLLAAQIHAESGWNPQAISPDGAVGLAQFMPATWAEVGIDGNRDGKAEPTNPADAIMTQAKYMCSLVRQVQRMKLKGDTVDLALAAYNAGIGSVQAAGGPPPFPETTLYVATIRALVGRYAENTQTVTGAGEPRRWVHPLGKKGAPLTSPFGPRWGKVHTGVDFAAPIGTRISAAADGVVTAAGAAGGNNAWAGNWVRIRHGGGTETIYAHISRWNVHGGQTVRAGQRIAAVGSEGNSTGPHLHLEVRLTDGQPVDPVDFYAAHGATLTGRKGKKR
jgi:murein DD-endopeptidase MepM/ murein hydrolase activator NlpD